MKLVKNLAAVTLAALALGCGTASASVIEHVQLGLQSGATFDGDINFADHYTSILGVDGYLVGHSYGNDHMAWTWNNYYDSQLHTTGIDGVLTDTLIDG